MVFPVAMYGYEFDYKESWAPKNWCFWTVVLEKAFEIPWDCKEIQPVNPKGNQSWIFIGRTDAEAEAPILRPPDVKNWLTGKDPDAGRYWRQEKGTKRMRWLDDITNWFINQWTWVWASSRSWWWTEKPGLLQAMGSQRVGHDWVTELNWTDVYLWNLSHHFLRIQKALGTIRPSQILKSVNYEVVN